ncbi:MAG: dihydrofolate reductase [Polaromonas sp.]|nr:dihydrofolate reductase [Polaromonas sp.]
MQINLIYARAANGVIGKNNAMPWHLPDDMAHFKQLTNGWPVIMGRKTWDSLPPRFRPLPGRVNIVITRQTNWVADGATVMPGLAQAFDHCRAFREVWVIGGAQIYALAEPLAHRAEVTDIKQNFDGDAFAPTLGPGWLETQREDRVSAAGLAFSFVTYHQRHQRTQNNTGS